MMDIQSTSSSRHNSHTPNPTEPKMNIAFLCNPQDEDPDLRQESVSELFGSDLTSVHKRSWAKDSACEQVHLT